MSDTSINRALVAAQLAKEQHKEQGTTQTIINPKATNMINEVLSAQIAEKAQAVQAEQATHANKAPSLSLNEPEVAPKPQSVYLNKSANVAGGQAKTAQKAPAIIAGLGDTQKDSGEDAKFTKVELSIAGTTHRINCPVGDVMTINRVAEQISDALRELRRSVRGKSPSNEELLVLHCLELYDQLRELSVQKEQAISDNARADVLVDKLLKDVSNIANLPL